jgi:excisionase family DNA binding protein
MTMWLAPAEAAAYLGIKRRTLLAWARAGHVKGYPLHGTKRHVWRFLKEDLDLAMGFRAPLESCAPNLGTASVVLQ